MERLNDLKMLIELCKERKQILQHILFFKYREKELYELSKKISRLATKLNIYAVNMNWDESGMNIAFDDLNSMHCFVGEESITKSYVDDLNKYKYSASLFNGDLTIFCYEQEEEHKKAQTTE